MSFETYMEQPDVRLMAYVYISGIPDVFSNVPQPARWPTLETGRSWSETLIWFRPPGNTGGESSKFDVPSARADWQAGLSVSGRVNLAFTIDPGGKTGRWIDLMLPTSRTNYYLSRDAVVAPSQTNLQFLDVTGLSLSDLLYGGRETVEIAAPPDAAAGTAVVRRGKYGSPAQWYDLTRESEVTFGGPTLLSTAPQTWAGRTVEVWLAACQVDNAGALVPLDTAPKGDNSWQLFRGVISEVAFKGGDTAVVFTAQDVSQLMRSPVLRNPKRYTPGPAKPPTRHGGWVYLEPDGPSIIEYEAGEYFTTRAEAVTGGAVTVGAGDLDLLATGGYLQDSGMLDSDGGALVETSQLATALVSDLNDRFAVHANFFVLFNWGWGEPAGIPENPRTIAIQVGLVDGGTISNVKNEFRFKFASARRRHLSVLPALGATEDVLIPTESGGGATGLFGTYSLMQEGAPAYYLAPGSTRLYYTGVPLPDSVLDLPPRNQGTQSLTGDVDPVFVRLGKVEIVAVDFYDGEHGSLRGASDARFAKVVTNGRSRLGTGRPGPITGLSHGAAWSVAAGDLSDSKSEMVVGLGFERHDMMDVLLWLASSNGDAHSPVDEHNVLPWGYGAALDVDVLDKGSFSRVSLQSRAQARGWWIESRQELRDLFGLVGRAYGIAFVPMVSDSDLRYRIHAVYLLPPPASVDADATLDASWHNTQQSPVGSERNARLVINRLEFQFDFDPLEKKYLGSNNSFTDEVSESLYGSSAARRISLPWVREGPVAQSLMRTVADWTFGEYGRPAARYTMKVYKPQALVVSVADYVAVTHPTVPNWRDGGLGLTDVVMQIESAEYELGPDMDGWATYQLIWRNSAGVRLYPYAPTLRLVESADGGTKRFRVRRNLADGGFSPTDEKDIGYYARAATEQWSVKLYLEHDETVYSGLVVDHLDTEEDEDGSGVIGFTTVPAAGLLADLQSVIVEFQPWTTEALPGYPEPQATAQRYHAFLARDSDLLLDASTPARRWR